MPHHPIVSSTTSRVIAAHAEKLELLLLAIVMPIDTLRRDMALGNQHVPLYYYAGIYPQCPAASTTAIFHRLSQYSLFPFQ